MADVFTRAKRSWIMGRIRDRDTKPEIVVRSIVHRAGFRFRLHRRDLPGNPDLVLPRHKKVIFVHGCFWHAHPGCARGTRPSSNRVFWRRKLDGNVQRDRRNLCRLRRMGWKTLVVWECETKKPDKLHRRIAKFLKAK